MQARGQSTPAPGRRRVSLASPASYRIWLKSPARSRAEQRPADAARPGKVAATVITRGEVGHAVGRRSRIGDHHRSCKAATVGSSLRRGTRRPTLAGGARLVAALTGCGMAHIAPHSLTGPAWLRPASPDLALPGVLAGHQQRLACERGLLLEVEFAGPPGVPLGGGMRFRARAPSMVAARQARAPIPSP